MHVEITEDLAHGRKEDTLRNAVREGLLIHDYLNAEISIGKFAELMGMNYTKARDYLHRRGIATMRTFTNPDLEKADENNYRKVSDELGILIPKA